MKSKVYLKKGIHRISFNLNKGRIEEISYYLLKDDFKELDSFNYLKNMIYMINYKINYYFILPL